MKQKVETVLIKNIEQLKQIIKNKSYNNYELVEPIMIKGVKRSKPRTEPKQKPKTLRQLMLEGFDKINNRLDNVDKRLDNLDKRLNNVVKLNKLKE
jgi:hypothetical protein